MTDTDARRVEPRSTTTTAQTRAMRRMTAGVAGAGVALSSAVVATPAGATVNSIEVTTTSDDGPGSFRAALAEAVGTPSDDQITFASSVTGTIDLTTGQLEATLGDNTGGVDIQGPGATGLTVDAGGQSRVFHFAAASHVTTPPTVALSGVTISGGSESAADGGGILAEKLPLSLDHVVVQGNEAENGGGVSARGGLTINHSTISGNAALRDGGGIQFYSLYGRTASIADSVIADNTARSIGESLYYAGGITTYGRGGGVAAFGTIIVADSTVDTNRAGEEGGGLWITDGWDSAVTNSSVSGNVARGIHSTSAGDYYQGDGGGLHMDRHVTLTGSTISDNVAGKTGGGIQGHNGLSMDGTTVAGNIAGHNGGGIDHSGPVTISASTISGNVAQGQGSSAGEGGGARLDFWADGDASSISDSVVSGNEAKDGGGVHLSEGAVNITSSSITGNTAYWLDSWGHYSYTKGDGGGLHVGAEVTLANSTLADNVAGGDGGGVYGNGNGLLAVETTSVVGNAAGGEGGGVSLQRGVSITGSTIAANTAERNGGGAALSLHIFPGNIADSTIAGNNAKGAGGGIDFVEGSLTLTGSTISDNAAVRSGGGVAAGGSDYDVSVSLQSSIVANNSNGDLDNAGNADFSLDHSLVQDTGNVVPTVAGASITGQDPLLAALSDNGGPTPTMLPGSNSPAIDQGNSFGTTLDQRGEGRPFDSATTDDVSSGDGTDIGAVELQGIELDADPTVANTMAPTTMGRPTVGETLTADPGTWDPEPDAVTYQWQRDGVEISSATSSTYVLSPDDEAAAISVQVAVARPGYTTGTANSDPVGPVEPGTITNTAVPVITGAAQVGQNLDADTGAWDPSDVTTTFQWWRDDLAVPGETADTYVLTDADEGAEITVTVTAGKVAYNGGVATSAATDPVAPAPAIPAITGRTRVGQTLHSDTGSWDPSEPTLAYQWLRGGSPIAGATAATYALTADDLRQAIAVEVTGPSVGGDPITVRSTATDPIRKGFLAMSRNPKVKGKPKVSNILRAKPKAWAVSPSPTRVKIKWYLDGKVFKRKTNKKRLKVKPWMRGMKVKVKFIYKPPAGYKKLKKVVKKRRIR